MKMMNKNLIHILILVACIAGLDAGLIRVRSNRAGCPTVVTKPDFDYLQYPGVWYESQRIPVVFEDGLTCVRAIYGYLAPNEISVLNTGVMADGSLTVINGTARQPFPDTEPGRLIVSFPGRPDGGYLVLDTDYVNYSAVYDCVSVGAFTFEYGWLLTRSNTPSAATTQAGQAAFTRNGIDITNFEITPQSNTCNYQP